MNGLQPEASLKKQAHRNRTASKNQSCRSGCESSAFVVQIVCEAHHLLDIFFCGAQLQATKGVGLLVSTMDSRRGSVRHARCYHEPPQVGLALPSTEKLDRYKMKRVADET